ncbi:unnamed protein product [Sphagnum balticum]
MVGKRRMVDKKQCSNEVSARPDICFMGLLQIAIAGREDDVEDVDDDDIGEEMNKQVPREGSFDGGYVFDDLGEHTYEDSDDWDKLRSYFGPSGI